MSLSTVVSTTELLLDISSMSSLLPSISVYITSMELMLVFQLHPSIENPVYK